MNFAAGDWTCAYPCCLAATTPAARPRTNTWTHITWHRFCAVPSRASANPGDKQEVRRVNPGVQAEIFRRRICPVPIHMRRLAYTGGPAKPSDRLPEAEIICEDS